MCLLFGLCNESWHALCRWAAIDVHTLLLPEAAHKVIGAVKSKQ